MAILTPLIRLVIAGIAIIALEAEIPIFTDLAGTLEQHAPDDLRWHYEPMPKEKHATIYHPAALKAFREVFAPEDSPEP